MTKGTQFSNLFLANLKMMFRERQVWFWNLFFPIILMVIFMVIFTGGGSDSFSAKIAVVESAPNATSDLLEAQLRQVPVFEWMSEQPVSMDQADEWIKNKDVDAVLVLPDNAGTKTLGLIFNKENETSATSQAISGIVGQFLEQANWSAAKAQPTFHLKVDSVSNGSKDLTSADFLMTGMIALSVAQGGLFGMVGMVEMRRSGLLKRLRMTPVKMGLFGLSGMLVRFILGVVQIVILAAIGVLVFGANLHISVSSLIIAFFIGTLTFNALGFMFSSFSKTLEAYMGVANIASFLMMFLSGIFFPTSIMPEWLVPVTKVLPLTYFVNGMRDGMVYGNGIGSSSFWLGIGVLVLWAAVAYIVGSVLYKRSKVEVR
jgi:ABC-2 type transport system permease protein